MFITGHLYHDVFSGVIVTDTETYVVEPSDRHFNTTQHFHTIIYKESDIVPVRGKMCGMVEGEVSSGLLFIQAGIVYRTFGAYISNTRHNVSLGANPSAMRYGALS